MQFSQGVFYLLLWTTYGLDMSDQQIDSQKIKYAIIIFVFLDVKVLEHSAKTSCHTNTDTSLK